MKNLFFSLLILSFFSISLLGQNKIVYAEFIGGIATSKNSEYTELLYGIEGNFQVKKILLSVRFVENYIPSIPLPLVTIGSTEILTDYSVLVGYRKIYDGFSFSFSSGISYNTNNQEYKDELRISHHTNENFLGIPFEANIKWFKKDKSPYKIYEIIPIGKPTSIGNSIGFKLLGNISKKSYIGLAIVYGIGSHKEY